MCGIVGAIAQRNVTPVLLEGLRRLEYRGYDSCTACARGTDVDKPRNLAKSVTVE